MRNLLGVGFPGEPSRNDALMGEMEANLPQEEIAANVTEIVETSRRFALGPSAKGHRVVVAGVSDRAEPPTLDDFKQQLRSIAGTDFGVHSPRWLFPLRGCHTGGRNDFGQGPTCSVARLRHLDIHLSRWFGQSAN